MSYCPNCKQEYREGIQECADCQVPLVDKETFEQAEQEVGQGAMVAAVFRAEDAETLDLISRAVAIQHIPYETREELPAAMNPDVGNPDVGNPDVGNPDQGTAPAGSTAEQDRSAGLQGHFLLVPMELSQKVAQILDHGLPMIISHGEGQDRVYRIFDQEREEEIRDPELLRLPINKLMARGEEIIDPLIKFVAKGDAATKARAAYVLTCLGHKGIDALIKLLKVAIEKEQGETASSLITVVRKEIETGEGWEEFCSLLSGSAITKILALQALTALENIEAFPSVLPLLNDDDPAVRDEADNTLCTLADEDMGFDAEAPSEERQTVVSKWEAWWTGRRNG